MAKLSCPLCCQLSFSSVAALQSTLINVLNGPLMCPICTDIQHNLDAFVAHLAKHIDATMLRRPPIEHGAHRARDVNNGIELRTAAVDGDAMLADAVHRIDDEFSTRTSIGSQSPGADGFEAALVSQQQRQQQRLQQQQQQPQPLPQPLPQLQQQQQQQVHQTQPPPADGQRSPIVCQLCACSFRTLQLHEMHMQLVHEAIAPAQGGEPAQPATGMLQCFACPRRFKMNGSLRLHARMVHGIREIPPKLQLRLQQQQQQQQDEQSCRAERATMAVGTDTVLVTATTAPRNGRGPRELLINTPIDEQSNANLAKLATSNGHTTGVSGHGGKHASGDANKAKKKPTTDTAREKCDGSAFADPAIGPDAAIRANDDRVHKCDICNKCFTTKYFLKKHKRIHTGETPYTCELCNRTFTFQQSYHRHLSYHTNERPHTCTVCGRGFKELSTLHNHQRIHSGEKPFVCETCGAMPYECTACEKKFRYKISLRTHKCTGRIEDDANASAQQLPATAATPPILSPPTPSSISITSSHTASSNNNRDSSSNADDNHSLEQSLDEFITESYNRLGITDHMDQPKQMFVYPSNNSGGGGVPLAPPPNINQATAYASAAFGLNELTFGELDGTVATGDLANVMATMNDIFPQTIDMIDALYDSVNSDNLHQFEM